MSAQPSPSGNNRPDVRTMLPKTPGRLGNLQSTVREQQAKVQSAKDGQQAKNQPPNKGQQGKAHSANSTQQANSTTQTPRSLPQEPTVQANNNNSVQTLNGPRPQANRLHAQGQPAQAQTSTTSTQYPTAPSTYPVVCRLVTSTLASICNPGDPRTQFLNLSHVIDINSSYQNIDHFYGHLSHSFARAISAMFPGLASMLSPPPQLKLTKVQVKYVYAIWNKGSQPEPSLITGESLQKTLRLLAEARASSALYVVTEVEWLRFVPGQDIETLRAPVNQGPCGQC